MEEYASALFVALIEEALRRQDLSVPAADEVIGRGQKVALARKQSLVRAVLARHGPAPLLRVGLGFDAFTGTPIAAVLARSSDPHDLFDRCLRMDRYFHSRHRTRIVARETRAVTFDHVAIHGPAPSAAEDVVVAGLFAALAGWRGARGIDLTCGDGDVGWAAISVDAVVAGAGAPLPATTARWRLAWSDVTAKAAPTAPNTPPTRACNGRALNGRWVRDVFAHALRDPAQRLSLGDCAAALALSTRSLQRRLTEDGMTFQEIVALARLHAAADLLANTDTPVGLIGLLAGYSDQPHFTREFRRGMDMTPLAFRRLAA